LNDIPLDVQTRRNISPNPGIHTVKRVRSDEPAREFSGHPQKNA